MIVKQRQPIDKLCLRTAKNPAFRPSWIKLSYILVVTMFMAFGVHDALCQSKTSAGVPFILPARSKVLALRSAKIETSKGNIYLELFPDQAPWTVANFKQLADRGFYAGLPFHLYEEGFLIQGGAPRGDPLGGPEYSLPAEFSSEKQVRGTVGMGRVMDQLNPERRSHGSQFYILLGSGSHMNGKYTAFGRVAKGMNVVDKLRAGDVIRNVTVYVRR